jgi:hypothetical protein
MEMLFTILGTLGAVMVLAMYWMNAQGKISAQSKTYFTINAIGAFLILVSALASYDGGDLGTVLLEGIWVLVSIVGLVKLARRSAV